MISPNLVAAPGVGPNIGQDEDSFFQSDRDLVLKGERKRKQEEFRTKGNPIQLPSKLLYFELFQDSVFIAQSGFICQRVDVKNQKVMVTFSGHNGPVTCLAMADSQHILTSSWDKTVKKWNIETGACLYTTKSHDDFVKSVKVFGPRFYTGSTDASIGVWDLSTGESISKIYGHTRSVEDLVISPDGLFLYSCSSDCSIRKWDLASQQEIFKFEGHETSIYRMAANFDDNVLWSVSGDKTAIRWDLATGKSDAKLLHNDFVKSIAILGNGFVITGGRDEKIRIWDPSTEKCTALIEAHFGEISCIQIDPFNPGSFYSASLDTTLRQWDLKTVLSKEKYTQPEIEESAVDQNFIMTEQELKEMEELMD